MCFWSTQTAAAFISVPKNPLKSPQTHLQRLWDAITQQAHTACCREPSSSARLRTFTPADLIGWSDAGERVGVWKKNTEARWSSKESCIYIYGTANVRDQPGMRSTLGCV